MNTHREDAAFLLERARVNEDATEALADSTAAVAHATLALAEEQRTANLHAYMEATRQAMRDAGPFETAVIDATVIHDWIGEQMAIIRERLGLEK